MIFEAGFRTGETADYSKVQLDFPAVRIYIVMLTKFLQGKVTQKSGFLTGGKVFPSPRAARLTRCDSVTDSKVWMQEESYPYHALIVL